MLFAVDYCVIYLKIIFSTNLATSNLVRFFFEYMMTTTIDCESFHSKLNNTFYKARPNVHRLIEKLHAQNYQVKQKEERIFKIINLI